MVPPHPPSILVRLESQVGRIKALINRFSYVLTTHSLRFDNMVADWFENWGTMIRHQDIATNLHLALSLDDLDPGDKDTLS